MNFLSRAACIAGLVASSIGGANAATVVNDWYFNPNGTGLATATAIHENLDFNGSGFIDITVTGPGTFSFTETAAFKIPSYDSGTGLPTPNFITAYFQASGTGTFNGAFTFNAGGTLKFYSDTVDNFNTAAGASILGANDGTLIGTFGVLAGGGGLVDASGNPTGNGQVTVNMKANAGDLVNGYWFGPSGAALTNQLAFAFTNANSIQSPSVTVVKELACDGAGYVGGFCPSGIYNAGNANGDLFVNNAGQFKLAIPEPTSVALIGLALVAAGAARRRAAAKV